MKNNVAGCGLKVSGFENFYRGDAETQRKAPAPPRLCGEK